jgi:hypothetical protein
MSRLVIFIVSVRVLLILLFSLFLIDQHSWRDGDGYVCICEFFATSKLQEPTRERLLLYDVIRRIPTLYPFLPCESFLPLAVATLSSMVVKWQ